MKVRTGFVSNSSTSSFVCVFVGVKLSDFAERRREIRQRTKYDEDSGKPYQIEEEVYRTFIGDKDITDAVSQDSALEYQIHEWLSDSDLTTFSHDADGYPGCYVGLPIFQTCELRTIVGFPDPSTVEEKRKMAERTFNQVGYQGPLQILLLTEINS